MEKLAEIRASNGNSLSESFLVCNLDHRRPPHATHEMQQHCLDSIIGINEGQALYLFGK